MADYSVLAQVPGLWALDIIDSDMAEVPESILGLTTIKWLGLERVGLTDAAPLAAMGWLERLWLFGNHVFDLSALAGLPAAAESLTTDGWPEDYWDVSGQTLTATAEAGSTVALPPVADLPGGDGPVKWAVYSGDAVIDAGAGTITYGPAGGTVLLGWAGGRAWAAGGDGELQSCLDDGGFYVSEPYGSDVPPSDDGGVVSGGTAVIGTCHFYTFSGSVSVSVSGPTVPGEPTEPSIPDSGVERPDVAGSLAGGSARLADGSDSYTLMATVRDSEDRPLSGLQSLLSAVPSDKAVTVLGITDNGNGTYKITVASDAPGNYTVDVLLDGESLGLVSVNFIGAEVKAPSVATGAEQSADGLGFLPGEEVTVTVHSDPIALGTFTADSAGVVPVTFAATLEAGHHSVEFTGAVSGTVSVPFDVVTSSGGNPLDVVQTGGSVADTQNSSLLALVLIACVLAAAGVSLWMVRRQSRHS